MARRKKILFFAEGITMTHFARPAVLAASLDSDEWDVSFWTPKRYHRLCRQKFSRLGDLRTIDPDSFLQSLSHGAPLYTAEALEQYVRDDMEIIQSVQPDLVIGDFRLSLSVSAPLCGVNFGSIFNAHWSPYRKQPAIVPELPATRWIPPRLLNLAFAFLRPSIFAAHARPVNDVRRSHGLPPISDDLREIYTAGDLVFYPDIPEFVPVSGAPAGHHYVGACSWTVPASKPDWWDVVMNSPMPRVFVSLGSSGPIKALPAILTALSELPVNVMLSTSSRAIGALPSNIHVADLLPYEETARSSAAVISHGGTGGLYPTLAAGTPMLAIPSNIDNHLSSALLEESGAGLSLRVECASPSRIKRAVERLILEPDFKAAAERLSTSIAGLETAQVFPSILRQWFYSEKSAQRVEEPALCLAQTAGGAGI